MVGSQGNPVCLPPPTSLSLNPCFPPYHASPPRALSPCIPASPPHTSLPHPINFPVSPHPTTVRPKSPHIQASPLQADHTPHHPPTHRRRGAL